jgi:hypothetical protein
MFAGKSLTPRALPAAAPLAVILALAPFAPAGAGAVPHSRVVSADPAGTTPHVLDGIVNALAVSGRTVIVAGSFSQVREAGGTRRLARSNIFAFDLTTGRVDPRFAPRLDGPVAALAASADGSVYAGGAFFAPGGGAGLTRLRLSDGAPVPGFTAQVRGGDVSALLLRGRHLYAGGDFIGIGRVPRPALARLDAVTGAVDPGFAVTPGGGRGPLKVHAMAASGRLLAVNGSFTTLDGLRRPQLGLIDIGAARPAVTGWRTEAYAARCKDAFPYYVRGLDFSPDGQYFVVVTTGGAGGPRKLCDSAARFEITARGAARPTWVNHTGGDSLYSVAVTGAAVYVGGHQRWLDNPRGSDSAGPGAVARPGIGAIDPVTGRALPWNPTRERGIGVKAFLVDKDGLLLGSDTTRLGHEYHARVGMFPLF